MKKIVPCKSYKYAVASLDNGGRFYNLRSKAKDGDISSAELAKAAGVFTGRQTMMLYLEMSLMDLDEWKKGQVLSHLSKSLKSDYAKFKPERFSPQQANEGAIVGQSAIITGIPKHVDSKTEFKGFIMIPISTGKTTTFTMVPLIDQYDIYELRDERTDQEFFIAHHRSKRKLSEEVTRCGGVIKELKSKKSEKSNSDKFLEMVYYAY